jgi:hypothetical protein
MVGLRRRGEPISSTKSARQTDLSQTCVRSLTVQVFSHQKVVFLHTWFSVRCVEVVRSCLDVIPQGTSSSLWAGQNQVF